MISQGKNQRIHHSSETLRWLGLACEPSRRPDGAGTGLSPDPQNLARKRGGLWLQRLELANCRLDPRSRLINVHGPLIDPGHRKFGLVRQPCGRHIAGKCIVEMPVSFRSFPAS